MDPEVQESLNYLRPPVKRLFRNRLCRLNEVETHTGGPIRSHARRFSGWDVRDTNSSVSLVVKKSEEKLFVEKYSVLSYTNLQYSRGPSFIAPPPALPSKPLKDKPLIKVTVISKDPPRKRKKRNPSKRIQTTVSNQENSVKSQNLYLVIKNRKGEKVYELKGTGSLGLSNAQTYRIKDDDSLNKQNLKKLIRSLNMDTKKKKGKKKVTTNADDDEIEEEQFERYSYDCSCTNNSYYENSLGPAVMERNVQQHLAQLHEKKMRNAAKVQMTSEETPSEEEPFEKITYDCKCPPSSGRKEATPRTPKKSQVTITGKLGLNHQDQYVLRCDASINDQPFQTVYKTQRGPTIRDKPMPQLCECIVTTPAETIKERNTNNAYDMKQRPQKEAMTQVNMSPENSHKAIATSIPCYCLSKETQCKPAHFNQVCFSNVDDLRIFANKDQTVQCRNDEIDSNDIIISKKVRGDEVPSNFVNPLVIISVYPKGESEGSRSRDVSPSRVGRQPKPVDDKPNRKGLPQTKPKSEKKPVKRDKSPTKTDTAPLPVNNANKTVKSPTKSPIRTPKFTAKTTKVENKTEKIQYRSASSSPPASPNRAKTDVNSIETKTTRTRQTQVTKISNDRSPTRPITKPPSQRAGQFPPVQSQQQRETKTTQQKEVRISHPKDNKPPQRHKPAFNPQLSFKTKYPVKKIGVQISQGSTEDSEDSIRDAVTQEAPVSKTKSINTDFKALKKAKVETLTHACDCERSGKAAKASEVIIEADDWGGDAAASNVAVSIDGENDLYAVLFQNILCRNSGRTTDCYYKKPGLSDGLQVYQFPEIIFPDKTQRFRRRDNVSRREEKSDSELVVTESLSLSAHDVFSEGNVDFVMPYGRQHYKGDTCSVTNPIDRDREIRELLGIEKLMGIPTTSPVSSEEENSPPSVETPVGTPTNTPVLTPVGTASSSARTSEEVFACNHISRQRCYTRIQRAKNAAVATVRGIVGKTSKLKASHLTNNLESENITKNEKIEYHYGVYHTNVRYHKSNSYRNVDVIVQASKKRDKRADPECCLCIDNDCAKTGQQLDDTVSNTSDSNRSDDIVGTDDTDGTDETGGTDYSSDTDDSDDLVGMSCSQFNLGSSVKCCEYKECQAPLNEPTYKEATTNKSSKRKTKKTKSPKKKSPRPDSEKTKRKKAKKRKTYIVDDGNEGTLQGTTKTQIGPKDCFCFMKPKVKKTKNKGVCCCGYYNRGGNSAQSNQGSPSAPKQNENLEPVPEKPSPNDSMRSVYKKDQQSVPPSKVVSISKPIPVPIKIDPPNRSTSTQSKVPEQIEEPLQPEPTTVEELSKPKPAQVKESPEPEPVHTEKPVVPTPVPIEEPVEPAPKHIEKIIETAPVHSEKSAELAPIRSRQSRRPSKVPAIPEQIDKPEKSVELAPAQSRQSKRTSKDPALVKQSDKLEKSMEPAPVHNEKSVELAPIQRRQSKRPSKDPALLTQSDKLEKSMEPAPVHNEKSVELAPIQSRQSKRPSKVPAIREQSKKPSMVKEPEPVEKLPSETIPVLKGTPVPLKSQVSSTTPEEPKDNANLVLNRNVNIYLQIEKFNRKKPIVLSRQQYIKVKKAIEQFTGGSSMIRSRNKECSCICNDPEIIDVDEENTNEIQVLMFENKCIQTCVTPEPKIGFDKCKNMNTKSVDTIHSARKESILQQILVEADELREKVKSHLVFSKSRVALDDKHDRETRESTRHAAKKKSHTHRKLQCGHMKPHFSRNCDNRDECNVCKMIQDIEGNVIFTVNKVNIPVKRAASSTDVHFRNSYSKQVIFSSTNFEENIWKENSSCYVHEQESSDTLYTIFKGHRKTPTPNLGTSFESLATDESFTSYKMDPAEDAKNRKPFLRRLMSCLVMRTKQSEIKFGRPIQRKTSLNSSVDSYHINTSLGAVELSSSIYDTSASFYTNHTVLPISTKMKRGFLSSFRGFLNYNRRT